MLRDRQLCWCRVRRREYRGLYIDRFDAHAIHMSFELNYRTKDDVKLVLEATFFWEVIDLPLIAQTTGDTSVRVSDAHSPSDTR